MAASLALATAGGLRAGRRRTALNEALHELRRPLQALALGPADGRVEPAVASAVQMASAALERLDRAINGAAETASPATFRAMPLCEAAVARWGSRAALAGGSLRLRRRAGDAVLRGDRCALAQALDNLVVNAIEHGGPRVTVEVGRVGDRLRIEVRDSGRGPRPPSRRETPSELIARLSGRRRRGHGLRLVRRIVAAHGGEFALRCADSGTTAVLSLPVLGEEEAR